MRCCVSLLCLQNGGRGHLCKGLVQDAEVSAAYPGVHIRVRWSSVRV